MIFTTKKTLLILFIVALISPEVLVSQEYTQNIKGRVYDENTDLPMVGVTIVIPGTDPVIGTISNEDGSFRIENVKLGRYSLQASFIGYQKWELRDFLLSSGKELVLNIYLEEKTFTTEEVVVRANRNKSKPLNRMATVSARSFTVEETNRYAGTFGDPARMASNYAGVVSMSTERNDIIIRGNSPTGVLWKLDDVEIPNPNHFGAMGTTGGPITILNHNFLTTSDFFTGAFPAEYSNAMAGVFDLHMRTGNPDKREHWAQLGWNGFEMGTEGPFNKGKSATYLASLRYSMFQLVELIGLDFYTPVYKDLLFKMNFPGKKLGKLSVFGIAGSSKMELWDSEKDSTEWTYTTHGEDITFSTNFAALAVSHVYFFNPKTNLKTSVSGVFSQNLSINDTFNITIDNRVTHYGENSIEFKYAVSGKLKHKFNAKHNLEAGYFLDFFDLNYKDSVYRQSGFVYLSDTKGSMTLLRNFVQWQWKFAQNCVLNTGINTQYLFYNESFAIEPRIGFRWNINELHAINMGMGMHSQMQPRVIYFYETRNAQNEFVKTNKQLDFSKSIHFILGYDFMIFDHMRLKAEVYYQYLYNIPVKREGFPQYSLINSGADYWVSREDSLVNKGKGKNIGIDLTLERFFNNNYYYLVTLSLFNSTYIDQEETRRNTSFNQNYIVNLLGGYELIIKEKNYITFNLKNVLSGGKRYVPIDIVASQIAGETTYDWNKAYDKRYKNFYRIDIRTGYKINMPQSSFEIAADLQNITNTKQPFFQTYDPVSGKVRDRLQLGFLPMLTLKLEI